MRAEVPSNYYYAIALQECSGRYCNNYSVVASAVVNNHAGVTPSVRASKFGSYRVCGKRYSWNSWQCPGNTSVYLGD